MNKTNGANPQDLVFYPAYCHTASPIYFTWVKLTASEIHHYLRTHAGFEGQGIYFYLNHPVQFVCLAGVVVVFESFHEKRWLFTLDDSSGETIDIVCDKPSNDLSNRLHGPKRDVDTENRASAIRQIDIGSVIQVKGTISVFRNIRQLHLERVRVLPNTNAEVEFWKQRVRTVERVLSKPWYLSAKQQKKLLKEADGRAAKRQERDARRAAIDRKDTERIERRYEKEERKRAQAAMAAKEAARSWQQSQQ